MPHTLHKYRDHEDGFTLIELLIVVLIIGILAAIAIPVYLGIQQQGYKSAVKSDVNLSVKRIQVGVTEGTAISDIKNNPTKYTQASVKGENLYIASSTTPGASSNDFSLSGVVNTSTSPAGPINFSYTYDSVTGNFTESPTGLPFGSAAPTIVITTGSLGNAVVGNAYSQNLAALATNPTGTTLWTATGLPANWSIDPSTGVISATAANVATAGSYTVAVTATNGAVSDTRSYALTVTAAPVISTSSLPAGTPGTAYNATIVASGSPTPTFTVASGALPDGVNLSASGVLSGTPTSAGTFPVTIKATNTAGNNTASYQIVIGTAPAITASFSDDQVNTSYAGAATATGYPAPTYAVSSGALPPGLTLDTATGSVTGTGAGTATGTYAFKITATNSQGSATTPTQTVVIWSTPTVTTATLAYKSFNDALSYYSLANTANAYPAPTTWSATGLPSGMSIAASTGTISGVPNATGVYTITVTANNGYASNSATYTSNNIYAYTQSVNGYPGNWFNRQCLDATGLPASTTKDYDGDGSALRAGTVAASTAGTSTGGTSGCQFTAGASSSGYSAHGQVGLTLRGLKVGTAYTATCYVSATTTLIYNYTLGTTDANDTADTNLSPTAANTWYKVTHTWTAASASSTLVVGAWNQSTAGPHEFDVDGCTVR